MKLLNFYSALTALCKEEMEPHVVFEIDGEQYDVNIVNYDPANNLVVISERSEEVEEELSYDMDD